MAADVHRRRFRQKYQSRDFKNHKEKRLLFVNMEGRCFLKQQNKARGLCKVTGSWFLLCWELLKTYFIASLCERGENTVFMSRIWICIKPRHPFSTDCSCHYTGGDVIMTLRLPLFQHQNTLNVFLFAVKKRITGDTTTSWPFSAVWNALKSCEGPGQRDKSDRNPDKGAKKHEQLGFQQDSSSSGLRCDTLAGYSQRHAGDFCLQSTLLLLIKYHGVTPSVQS